MPKKYLENVFKRLGLIEDPKPFNKEMKIFKVRVYVYASTRDAMMNVHLTVEHLTHAYRSLEKVVEADIGEARRNDVYALMALMSTTINRVLGLFDITDTLSEMANAGNLDAMGLNNTVTEVCSSCVRLGSDAITKYKDFLTV